MGRLVPITIGRAFFIFLCFIYACSCNKSPLAEYGEPFETIMQTDTSLFRSFNLGASPAEIKANEPKGLKEETRDSSDNVDYLFYELSADSSTSYTIAYYCPNNKLDNIETDIYLLNEPMAADLFNSFKKYFEKKYGTAKTAGDFFEWTANTRMGKANISLADESATYKRGKLTLVIHDASEE